MPKKKTNRSIPSPSTPEGMPFTKDGIPKSVADLMVKRAFLLGGPPTFCAFASFPLCYWLIKSGTAELTPGLVILISLGFVALGSGGAVYGMFSTPWTAQETYSFWGWRNFQMNLQRMQNALRTEGERLRLERDTNNK